MITDKPSKKLCLGDRTITVLHLENVNMVPDKWFVSRKNYLKRIDANYVVAICDLFTAVRSAYNLGYERLVIVTNKPSKFRIVSRRIKMHKFFRELGSLKTEIDNIVMKLYASRDWFVVSAPTCELAFGIWLGNKYLVYDYRYAREFLLSVIAKGD